MVRLDTAGFWKYMNFYGHSKPVVVPIDPDPVTPVDPCSKCPEWYTCDWNWVCKPGHIERNPWDPIPWNIDNRQPNKDESKVIISTPTPIDDACTQEYSLKSWWSVWWYIELENWFITWADYNSWVRYYLSWKDWCWSKATYEWRIWEIDSTWYNRIEYWFWDINSKNIAISNISSADANNPNDRFRITLKNNWDYLIEVQRVISSSEMYDWTTYKSWNCLEKWGWWTLDYSVPMWMIIWVNGKALLTSTIRYENASEYIAILYDTDRLKIKHNVSKKELTLIDGNWDSITMMDRNLWATAYYQEEWKTSDDWVWNFYDWWNNYWFTKDTPEIETEQVDGSIYWPSNPYSHNKRFKWNTTIWYQWWIWKTTAYPNMWWWRSSSDIDKRWPCPEWYHIPTTTELMKARNMLSNAMSIIDNTICRFLLMPLTWARLVWGMDIRKTNTWYYWACNVPSSLHPIFNELQAYHFAFGEAQSGRTWWIEEVTIWFSCCIRPFKNTTS